MNDFSLSFFSKISNLNRLSLRIVENLRRLQAKTAAELDALLTLHPRQRLQGGTVTENKVIKGALPIPEETIAEFCQRWDIQEFSLFGSVLRDGFRPDSDIDVLFTFVPTAEWGLLTLTLIRHELEDLFGRKVDLVSKRAIETSPN